MRLRNYCQKPSVEGYVAAARKIGESFNDIPILMGGAGGISSRY
jgi:hypothetical protein